MRPSDTIPIQRVTVTIDLVDEPGVDTLAASIFVNVAEHLERDGIRPYRTNLEITTPTTR